MTINKGAGGEDMVGISACAAYIPFTRLDRGILRKGLKGEKAVARFDEDSITLAVAAVLSCLEGIDRQSVDGLFFASTTSPYKEKQAASIIAAAADLGENVFTVDFANSLKAGTSALKCAAGLVKAGEAKRILVVAADCRLGIPGSAEEQALGDGAAAVLISDSDVIAELTGSHSTTNEIIDIWRTADDTFVRSWESRFAMDEGYQKIVGKTALEFAKRGNINPKDISKIAFSAPDARRYLGLAKSLGLDTKTQVQDALLSMIGDTGTAHPLLLLVAMLESASTGDLLLVASYGDGSDAMAFRVTNQINQLDGKSSIMKCLENKQMIDDYKTYLLWKGLLIKDVVGYPGQATYGSLSSPDLWRAQNEVLRFHGSKCKTCGTVHYPPQRVCSKCRSKDEFEEIRLSDQKGKMTSFSMDFVASPLDRPMATAVIDFEVGGRIECFVVDHGGKLEIGMPVGWSFRRLFKRDGIHNYFWKAKPI